MTTVNKKPFCSSCGKENGRVTCEGCSNLFCLNHFDSHRQELATQLDEIEVTRDLFRQTLTENLAKAQNHASIQHINEWENESINKIRQAAEEARQILLKHIAEVNNKLESELKKLTSQLRESRQENDFFESNLNQWREKLTQMKNELVQPSSVTIRNDPTALVTKITVVTSNNNFVMKNYNVLCTFCKEQFTSEKSLMEHLMMCGNKTDQCPNCRKYVRRAIIRYHYENNCAYPDAPSIDNEIQQITQSEQLSVSVKCVHCKQDCDRADIKAHEDSCRCNPSNLRKRSQSLLDVNSHQNLGIPRSSKDSDDSDDRIPCEWCNEGIPLRFYSQHADACGEGKHQQLQQELQQNNQNTIHDMTFPTNPVVNQNNQCKICGKFKPTNKLVSHEKRCAKKLTS